MSKGIVPTQGRVVLCYHPTRWRGALPGMIVQAHGDAPESLVNVKVLNDGNNFGGFDVHNMMSVRVYDPAVTEAEKPDCPDGYCTWMPFQVGQAVKTEQAEAFTEERVRAIIRDELEKVLTPDEAEAPVATAPVLADEDDA